MKTSNTLPIVALCLFAISCSSTISTQANPATTPVTKPITNPDPNQPPLLIKHLGVQLGTYDPATGRAGDFMFTQNKLSNNRIWMDYAYVIPSTQTSTGQNKANPQPTFILPLGTQVRSLVDGVVVSIETLYSGDYSVMVSSDMSSAWRYETEHVLNPVVKVGDRVTAGQVIAEVSTWDKNGNDGLGMFEIGILKGGNPPAHVCPFAYLDPSVKEDLQQKILDLYAAWESYRGDVSLYDPASMPVVGCQTLESVDK